MKKSIFIAITILSITVAYSQNDSLVLKNGDVIIGELKNMDRGVATFETDYSDSDFKIEWDGITKIFTVSNYMITLSVGTRLNGRIESSGNKNVKLILEDGEITEVNINDIVFLKSVDKGFWDQVYASVDLGLDLTRAQHLSSFSTRSKIGYLAQRWSADLNFNTFISTQDDADKIQRTDGGISYNYYLPRDWYIPVSFSYLSNTEQRLDARWNGLLGIGKFVIHTNRLYWGFAVGTSLNMETYSPLNEPKTNTQSFEGYFGTELNLFDLGDFSLSTKARAYPSFTESGRWRADFNLDTKYDLP
ncbi:MAG: DUF481 domain-containing protein, partial [Bacteroidota bacterium]